MDTVLAILVDHGLYANEGKCEFGSTAIAYLGHIISKKGVSMNPNNVKVMVDWSTPRTLRELQGFLGYYKRFIQGYAKIAFHLTQ